MFDTFPRKLYSKGSNSSPKSKAGSLLSRKSNEGETASNLSASPSKPTIKSETTRSPSFSRNSLRNLRSPGGHSRVPSTELPKQDAVETAQNPTINVDQISIQGEAMAEKTQKDIGKVSAGPAIASPIFKAEPSEAENDVADDSRSILSGRALASETFSDDEEPPVEDELTQWSSIMLREAVADTPSFRASAEFLDLQFKTWEQWLLDLVAKSEEIVNQLPKVKDAINQLISIFMPSTTHTSILAHDYTTLLFGRFTEFESTFWTELLANVTRNVHAIRDMVQQLKDTVFLRYKNARRDYLAALKEMNESLYALWKMPYQSEPAALRDVSLRVYTSRKKYLKTATVLVTCISELECESTISIIDTLGKRFSDLPNGFQNDPSVIEMSIEFHRLKSFADNLRESLPEMKGLLKRSRARLLKTSGVTRPPKNLKYYQEDGISKLESQIFRKTGWVNVEVQPGTWTMLWAYVENGLFGFLGQSENHTAVLESARFAVPECTFEILKEENHHCIFQIRNGEASVKLQATGVTDLLEWQKAFENTARLYGSKGVSTGENAALKVATRARSTSDPSPRELLPWNSSFAIPGLFTQVAPGSDSVAKRIRDLRLDVNSPRWLRYDSTLTVRGANAIGSTVPSVKPLPMSASLEATVANTYYKPQGIPNAIIGNIWGSVSNAMAPSQNDGVQIVHFGGKFPRYPNNYPRALIVQDMDMRLIAAELPAEQKLEDDDFLLFFIRATIKHKGYEAPARLYVTGKKIIVYASWCGIVHLQSYDVANIMEVETRHGVDASILVITVQDPVTGDAISRSDYGLYVDSSRLAKQRLDYVVKNRRSRHPKSCLELLEPIAFICLEYSSALKQDETRMEREGNGESFEDFDEGGNEAAADKARNRGQNSLVMRLLSRPIGGDGGHKREESEPSSSKGMQYKLAEDTFSVSARTLFTVIFGPKSPAFAGHHSGIVDSDVEVGPWYRKGRRVERRVAHIIHFSGDETANKKYNYQRIDRQDHDAFTVTERTSSWEMPRGDQFYTVVRYVVYSTEQGSNLQIWCRINWLKKLSGSSADETVRPFNKLVAQATILRIREAVAKVKTLEEAQHLFGKVRATKVISNSADMKEDEEQVTRVSARTMALIIFRSPFLLSYKKLSWFALNMFHRFLEISGWKFVLFVLLMLSFFSNYKFYERSNESYWNAYLETQQTEKYVSSLKLMEDPTSMRLTRAIYLKDVDDMISEGTLWTSSFNLGTIANESQVVPHSHGCAAKFCELAKLSTNDFGSLYEFEPNVQDSVERITNVRLDYALRRNELLTMLRVLNHKEREALLQEYRSWLVSEASMCSKARPALQVVNSTIYEEIKEYCVNCLEEAKSLI